MCAYRQKRATHWISSGLIEATRNHQQTNMLASMMAQVNVWKWKKWGKQKKNLRRKAVEIKNDQNTCHFYGNTCRFQNRNSGWNKHRNGRAIYLVKNNNIALQPKVFCLLCGIEWQHRPKHDPHSIVSAIYLWKFLGTASHSATLEHSNGGLYCRCRIIRRLINDAV